MKIHKTGYSVNVMGDVSWHKTLESAVANHAWAILNCQNYGGFVVITNCKTGHKVQLKVVEAN